MTSSLGWAPLPEMVPSAMDSFVGMPDLDESGCLEFATLKNVYNNLRQGKTFRSLMVGNF